MTQTYKLITTQRVDDMVLRLKKAIDICENAKPINWDTYDSDTVDAKTTYPGALGHAQGALSWVLQDLELFATNLDTLV